MISSDQDALSAWMVMVSKHNSNKGQQLGQPMPQHASPKNGWNGKDIGHRFTHSQSARSIGQLDRMRWGQNREGPQLTPCQYTYMKYSYVMRGKEK